jgi:transcription factor C subunit 3
MTAWLKTKYKERPDMRTLRSAVKQLVDAGKLRQQTFCGRDSKGVMVTKNIICKPELPPDDPIIKDLQANILASDARYYFPPGVEIDPSLTRQKMTPKGFKQPTNVPVEPTITVQLHQKPASVAALEKRRGQNLQRRLLRKLEMEGARENMQETRPSGVIRLLSIQRPEPTLPPMHNLISSFGDAEAWAREEEFTGRKYRSTNASARHLKRFLSMMASHTMLMNPRQSFNPNNGTFSTDAGIAVIAAAKAQPRIVQRREPHLPESLDDLFTQTRKRDMPLTDDVDPRSRNFFRDTNRILRWELQNEELLQRRSGTLHYINQGIQDSFESAPIEGGIRFDDGDTEIVPQSSVQTREQAHSSLFIHHEHPPFKAQPTYEPAIDFGNSTVYSRAHLPSSSNVTPSSFRHSLPQHRRIEKLNEVPSVATDPIMSSQNRQHGRRNRLNAQLPRSAHQRITMTIVVVRALAGGADGRMVDWPLVSHCFPDQDPKTVQDKGKGILSRNRLQIAKMQSDFQERYIEAYANDEVPPIDYDDLYAYDWNAVIDWASTQLDIPKSERVPDLPATRQQFDEIFELREEPLGSLDEYYQHSGVTALRKKALISSVAFATPLSSQHSRRPNTQLSRFDTVKTWIRANTITPAEVYRPSDAKKALSFIDGGTLNAALQSLVVDRVIYQNAKGRSVPGRNYDMTDHFLQTLSKRRPIELAELRRAVKFKTETLDPTLTSQGVCSVAYGAEDGDILALINLLFQGRITLRPRDPPRDKFGLTEGGYLTRMMNKDKLRFPVDVYPVKDRYIRGNPISEKTSTLPPPCPPLVAISETLSIPETIPLWFDIHGGFIRVVWDQAVSAVLGCVAARPGITASNVASMVKPTLGAWEIELLLEWLVELGVMWKTGDDGTDAHESCWAVKEWWWMVMC